MRWCDKEKNIILTGSESTQLERQNVLEERQRTERERQRAEHERQEKEQALLQLEQLQAKLRVMGIEPNQ